jgi:lipopolysaccharide transport system ATP-binding protein
MPEIVIRVENLSKRYIIRHELHEGGGLRHVLQRKITAPFRWLMNGRQKAPGGAESETFWALRDVSFEVKRGEVLGIIGRNGAGKSTLLKILARITEPTRGRVLIKGRVGSLLEVGTGFHPELTGRENIYLNGAILGMSRKEITRKFDEIVAFADVERFLDTPVKYYSNGMYVRLAFAVAAHLEPEILVVDEVLAVGDTEFQQKCIGKMRDVTKYQGRTVIFVSHNMGAISSLTNVALYLDSGRLAASGPTQEMINGYLADRAGGSGHWRAPAKSGLPVQIVEAKMLSSGEGITGNEFEADAGFVVELGYEVRTRARNVLIEFFIYSADGVHLLTSGDHDTAPERYENREPGFYRARIRVPGNILNTGTYSLRVNCGTRQETFDLEDVVTFRVIDGRGLTSRSGRRGLILPMLPWEMVDRNNSGK